MGFFDSWKCVVRCYLRRQVFYPGNVVEGFVELVVTSPIQMVAIRVKATGKEKVRISWTTDNGNNSTTRHVRTETTCVYKQLITLTGQMKCSGQRQPIVVPPGRYTYPFAFQLPMNIPPSFSRRGMDNEADILYHIKAYVDIPFGRDAVDRQWFTVVKPMPLSQWLHRGPVCVDRNWQVTFCCCVDKGTVTGRLSMDRTIIAIDRDNLLVIADIDNTRGREPVKSLEIDLIHSMTYRACERTSKSLYSVGAVKIVNTPILPGTSGRIAGTIPLPRGLVPTLVSWCITSEYFINLELNIPWATDPKHSFAAIIAQAVDETDQSPPVVWNGNPFPAILKGQHPEYYYQPLPNPCYQLNPIPIGPPPGAMLWNVQLAPRMPLPPAGWMPPATYQMQRPPGYDPSQVQWQGGVAQQEAVVVHAPPPQLSQGTPGYGTADGSSGAPPAQPQTTASEATQPLLARG